MQTDKFTGVCINCKNLPIKRIKHTTKYSDPTTIVCSAFPDGIPYDIAYGNNQHSKPIEGQGNDFVYEPIKKTD
jgi:hypothetical protein